MQQNHPKLEYNMSPAIKILQQQKLKMRGDIIANNNLHHLIPSSSTIILCNRAFHIKTMLVLRRTQ